MKKVLKWEFWPFWFFYLPVYVVYLWYALRSGTMAFFSAANPSMKMGGFIDYSKFDILQKIPDTFKAKSFLISPENAFQQVIEIIQSGALHYPIILKPDRGQRGFAVQKIKDDTELRDYLNKYKTDLVLQEYIDYPLEFGVMYHRIPDQSMGHITSIVKKHFLKVRGDGQSDLKTLFRKSERAQYYTKLLDEKFANELSIVLPKGQEKTLVEIGNHCKGATFYDGNHLINDELTQSFNEIAVQIEGFYFGRFDVRVQSIDDLNKGRVKIVELNGANSEPAHIYDPKMPLFKAYGAMFRHWKALFLVSRANHKKGIKYVSSWQGYKMTREHFKKRKAEIS